jgi:hypothetical protein
MGKPAIGLRGMTACARSINQFGVSLSLVYVCVRKCAPFCVCIRKRELRMYILGLPDYARQQPVVEATQHELVASAG